MRQPRPRCVGLSAYETFDSQWSFSVIRAFLEGLGVGVVLAFGAAFLFTRWANANLGPRLW